MLGNGVQTKKDFLQNIYNRSKDLGLVCGVKHGEGFISDKPICIDDIFPVSIRMEEPNVYEKFGISTHQIKEAAKLIIYQR